MDLVQGEWIDRYCESRGLVARERVELFATVCDAVHYAHQNLVLHRDLKPANILVSADGTPHLLDFGIAKLLDPTGGPAKDVTATEFRALTPRYASPEQVTGAPLTTASDVYSLGVLLYELLAGVPPYEIRTRSPEELVLVICRQEPERPSTVMRRALPEARPTIPGAGASPRTAPPDPDAPTVTGLTAHGPARSVLAADVEGDLDWIVLKTLRKEPERRYASARELAEDIRRHLEGRPVLARPDTAGYRLGKFVRRHRGRAWPRWSRWSPSSGAWPEASGSGAGPRPRMPSLSGASRTFGGWPVACSSRCTTRWRSCPARRPSVC